MRRTGFKRAVLERSKPVYTPIPLDRRRGVMAVACEPASAPIEKENLLQHLGYMAFVRTLRCAHCGAAGPSQFCHSDQGKGTGIKSDCRHGWPGCDACHVAVGTKRIYPKAERRLLEARMAAETRAVVQEMGRWPKSLPMLESGLEKAA